MRGCHCGKNIKRYRKMKKFIRQKIVRNVNISLNVELLIVECWHWCIMEMKKEVAH